MSKPKYPHIKLVRSVKEQMYPELVKTKVIRLLNSNPKVDAVDIRDALRALERLGTHGTSDEYDAIYSKYITLQRSRKG